MGLPLAVIDLIIKWIIQIFENFILNKLKVKKKVIRTKLLYKCFFVLFWLQLFFSRFEWVTLLSCHHGDSVGLNYNPFFPQTQSKVRCYESAWQDADRRSCYLSGSVCRADSGSSRWSALCTSARARRADRSLVLGLFRIPSAQRFLRIKQTNTR